MFDLDAYLARIGSSGRPTVAEVHRAHVTSIPFENLDPRRGVPVSLSLEDLQRKLVRERRGGYCFEMNLLLKAALESMGADVEMLRYRVVQDGPELVLQMQDRDGWRDLYGFVPEPVPIVDVELGNWFTSTHPRSPFVTGLIVSTQRRDGTRTSLSDWNGLALTEQTPDRTTVTPVEHASVAAMLDERFGLKGLDFASDGRLGLAPTSRPQHHLR